MLIEQYLPLVRHVVGRLTVSLPSGIDRDDLQGAGIMGLIRAAETWDEAKGASFKTFAFTAIRGAILDELRRLDPVPRGARERIRKLEVEWRELTSELGRPPTHVEVCARLACRRDELDADLNALHYANQLSLDNSSDDETPAIANSLACESANDPFSSAEQNESIDVAYRAIGSLSEQARRAVVLYYNEGLLLKDIGSLLGVSESRVSQILSQALATLRLSLKVSSSCNPA